jgi:hypothetical protein
MYEWMNWKGYGRKQLWLNFKHCPGIRLERTTRTTKTLNQDSPPPHRDVNPVPPDDKTRVLSTRHWSSVTLHLPCNSGERILVTATNYQREYVYVLLYWNWGKGADTVASEQFVKMIRSFLHNLRVLFWHKMYVTSNNCNFPLAYTTKCGQENRINGRGDPLRWLRNTLYPQKLVLTSPTSGGRSVGIVRLRTKGHGV